MEQVKRQLQDEAVDECNRKEMKLHKISSEKNVAEARDVLVSSSFSDSLVSVDPAVLSKATTIEKEIAASKFIENTKMNSEIKKVSEFSSGNYHLPKSEPSILPAVSTTVKSTGLYVNPRQRGNPILKFVRNVPWEFAEIIPDYVMGVNTCALFLSLRYHQLNPNYIHDRLKQLGKSFGLRIMLVQVDIREPHSYVKDLSKICILTDCTLILAFSVEEAGRYLEIFKIYEFKPPEAIMEKTDDNFLSKFNDCLTTVKSVNKTDASTLLAAFGTLEGVMRASQNDLSLCPGFGPHKAKRLHDVFHTPFMKRNVKSCQERQNKSEEVLK